jgi:2-isopropylmalate synthase
MTGSVSLEVTLRDGDAIGGVSAEGNGPIAAFLGIMQGQGIEVRLFDYVEHALSAGGDAHAASYVELEVNGRTLWGVGIDPDISTASLKAVVSAINRAIRLETGARELATA